MEEVNASDKDKRADDLFVTQELINKVSAQAKQSPRLRKNYNFHNTDQDVCHRLLNAMEPGSYIQPHRHLDINKDESLVVLRGRFGVIIFDDKGNVEEKAILDPAGDVMITNMPHGIFHTLISLEKGGVFFESKAGPFTPLSQDEKAHWAPAEGDKSSEEYLAALTRLFEPD